MKLQEEAIATGMTLPMFLHMLVNRNLVAIRVNYRKACWSLFTFPP